MKRRFRCTAAAALPIIMTACAGQTGIVPFHVTVRGPASSCFIEVKGRQVTVDALSELARAEAKSGRRAHVDVDMADTPYQCIGGTIYALQRAGFKDVSFITEPPAQP